MWPKTAANSCYRAGNVSGSSSMIPREEKPGSSTGMSDQTGSWTPVQVIYSAQQASGPTEPGMSLMVNFINSD